MADSQAEYMRTYRKQRPDYRKQQSARWRARHRALMRLSRLYPNVFDRLFAEELRAEGLGE